MAIPALAPLVALALGALPAPPGLVVRETSSFGTVTVDHKAHLAARVRCSACHGPGPVGKITFTARTAHESCRSCHVAQQRGPTECRGCHVVADEGTAQPALPAVEAATPPPSAPALASAHQPPAPDVAPTSPGAPGATAGLSPAPAASADATRAADAAGVASEVKGEAPGEGAGAPGSAGVAVLADAAAPPASGAGAEAVRAAAPVPGMAAPAPTPTTVHSAAGAVEWPAPGRTVTAGGGVMATSEGWSAFPSFTYREPRRELVFEHTLTLALSRSSRTQFLFGMGRGWELAPRVRGAVLAVAGIDAVQAPPAMSPAVGVRGALEVLPAFRLAPRRTVVLSVTLLTDLLALDGGDGRAGRTSAVFTIAGAVPLP